MNISQVNSYNFNRQINNNTPTFKNGALVSTIFMEINKHDIIGVSLIDLLSMVIPRSIVDFTRNKEAGIETAIRESSSTATHASIGLSGIIAATILAQSLKHKKYGVDFKSVTASSDTIDAMATLFKKVVDENPAMSKEDLTKTFLNKVFEDVQGLAGNSDNGEKTIWYALKQDAQQVKDKVINTKNKIIEILLEEQNSKSYKLPSNALAKLEAYMNIDIPSTRELKVTLAGQEVATKGEYFLADVHSLTKAFTQENVLATFKKSASGISSEFVQDLKKLSLGKTTLGLAAICAVALSMQTINRKLTKKRTGRDGFVGDPDYLKLKAEHKHHKKDSSFYAWKALAVLGMGFYIFKTLNVINFTKLLDKVQFKGSFPTVDQIKLVYGSTILGRLFAASDKNELRESSFRDFLGYTNFLVLGELITRCFVNWKNKALINYDEATHGKGLWNWLKNSTVKTHQEVVNSTFKHAIVENGNVMSLKEIYRNNWIKPASDIAQKLSVLNKAKLIGMAYSCIALGIFVPLINKHMTERKRKHVLEAQKSQDNNITTTMPAQKDKTQKIINEFLTHRASIKQVN